MKRLWLISMLSALLIFVLVALSGCEDPETASPDSRDLEECHTAQTEAMCEACCDSKATLDYTFGTDQEPLCQCQTIP